MKLGWIGAAAFQVLRDGPEMVFDLAEGSQVPKNWKEGDDVEIVDHPDLMLAVIPDRTSRGYYEITHRSLSRNSKSLTARAAGGSKHACNVQGLFCDVLATLAACSPFCPCVISNST